MNRKVSAFILLLGMGAWLGSPGIAKATSTAPARMLLSLTVAQIDNRAVDLSDPRIVYWGTEEISIVADEDGIPMILRIIHSGASGEELDNRSYDLEAKDANR